MRLLHGNSVMKTIHNCSRDECTTRDVLPFTDTLPDVSIVVQNDCRLMAYLFSFLL